MLKSPRKYDRESLFAAASVATASLPTLPPGEEIYDIMPPQGLQYPWWELVVQTLLVVAIFYLLWLFYCWLTMPVVRERKPVVQSPKKQAQRAIARLKLSPVWQQRQLKEICEIFASILKTYAREGFGIGIGAAATTDEFMAGLRGRVMKEVVSEAGELLMICDQIKYCGLERHEKTPEDLLKMLEKLIVKEEWQK